MSSNFEFFPSDATEFLKDKKAKDLIPKDQRIVSVWPSYKISALLNFFGSHHILCCPVIDDNDRMVDVVSIIDVVNFLSSLEDTQKEGRKSRQEMRQIQVDQRTVAGFQLREGTVDDVLDFVNKLYQRDQRERPQIIDPKASAFSVLQLLSQGYHRVWILNAQGTPQNVITQHDAFMYLHQLMLKDQSFQEILNTSLRGLNLKERMVRMFPLDISLRFALGLLGLHGGALALVDSLGTIRANFSPIDVKGLVVEQAPSLSQSAYYFLKTRSHGSLEPLTVEMNDTLGMAAEKFFRFGVHHLWVVDRFSKPIAPFSLTDYLKVCLTATCKYVQPEAGQTELQTLAQKPQQQKQYQKQPQTQLRKPSPEFGNIVFAESNK